MSGLLKCGLLIILLMVVASSVMAEESLSLNTVPSSGKAPLAVTFNLVSSEEINSVSWDFDGDGKEDSTEISPQFTYAAGKHTATAKVTTASGSSTVSTTVNVDEPFSVSVLAVPSSGIAPLNVKFTATVSEFPDKNTPFMFAWDFNNDGVVDSVEQNPSYTFENVGDATVKLVVSDPTSSFSGSEVTKKIPITVSSYDSKINIASYFPVSLQLKENQVTFIVSNAGTETIKDISAKVIGEGIQHLSSTTISRLKPGEQDSLTVKMNVLKEGSLTASVKIDEKIFPVTFAVAEQVKVNKEELETNLLELKEKLKTEEDKYYEKKADGYLVSEVFDTIKSTKGQLQDAQEKMLTGRLQEAQVNVNLVGSAIADITYRLDDAKKPNQTVLSWMKDNLVTITAIIAAVGTLSGVAVKLSKGAKKLGEDVAGKVAVKLKKDGKAKEAAVSTEIKVEKESILEKDSLPVEEKK
ncbi:MAG TPA: PKD domain-containing protein [Candidatus Nanoarchaeia archaeon]|nr:PKD domain-containing protein [Candidatus Nanoarchaeia archaeon]